jgi:hypothetical protein
MEGALTMQRVPYSDPFAGIDGVVACLIALPAVRQPPDSMWIGPGAAEHPFQLGTDVVIARSRIDDPLPLRGCGRPASQLRRGVPSAGQGE